MTKRKVLVFFMVIIILLMFSISAIINHSKAINNNDITCIDGDTFKLGNKYIRLLYVDTPEAGDQLYNEASKYTCDYLKNNQDLILVKKGKDKYNRILGVVYRSGDSLWLNELLTLNCLAEPYWENSKDSIIKYYYACQKKQRIINL